MTTPEPPVSPPQIVFDPAHPNLSALAVGSREPSDADLALLAVDNGLLFRAKAVPPNFWGCVFQAASYEPFVFDSFATPGAPRIWLGNYHPNTVFGRSLLELTDAPTSHSWGYLAIQLDRPFPNLLLVSTAKRPGDMMLPIRPDPDQGLSLEGDFDQHFTFYCTREREEEALYVITPDLMALLIDEAAPFDVEIANDQLFIYQRQPFELRDPATYQLIFSILRTIGAKIGRQTGAYQGSAVADVAATDQARHRAGVPVNANYLVSRSRFTRYRASLVIASVVVIVATLAVVAVIVLTAYFDSLAP